MSTEWIRPDISGSDLTYTITSSVLVEFAQGHTVSDVLRELTQNEYDAGGRSLSVIFGNEALEIHGNGREIDSAGWRRLSVMLGTGHVIGQDRDVPEKTNGIGSKNHGLRSLFLMGDEIYVRSGGLQTVLDLHRGTMVKPLHDEASSNSKGAHVYVPYRTEMKHMLESYDADREAHDLDVLSEQLAPTLLKLADPGASRSLREVAVSSVRCKRVLTWEQKVKLVRRHRLRGPLLHRTIVLRDKSGSDDAETTRIRELEYQKSYRVPPAFRGRSFPAYFRVRGGRVRIGISLRLKRNRPDLDHRGSFFYPLGFANSATGCAVGANAPFEMNGDRSALVDPGTSSWNMWLLQLAADFIFDLLVEEWMDDFGPAGYLAIGGSHASSVPDFTQLLEERLRDRECWPTRKKADRSRRPRFVTAGELMLGISPELDDLVSNDWRLDNRVADPRIAEMALGAGARQFTIRSAIRLKCAGEDGSDLATSLGEDAKLYYPDFPGGLQTLEEQEKLARAFDAHRHQLTVENRTDLADSPTTLTASGELQAPSAPIWVVDDDVASAAPVSEGQRLHPHLARYQSIRKLCRPFDTSAWAVEVATRATEDLAEEAERAALYRHILRAPETIRRSAWPKLRRAPIIRDHRGNWVAPVNVVRKNAASARLLERALHFPNKQVARKSDLVRRLHFRKKVTGDDLVRHAQIVAEQPELATNFEKTLAGLRRLLLPKTVTRLRSIPFLRSTQGELVAPEDAYIRGHRIIACIGEDALYATAASDSLLKRLGCLTAPRAKDIIRYLSRLRSDDEKGPPAPSVVYPELVAALRVESSEPTEFADEPILYDGKAWLAPDDVLIGKLYRRIFLDAVPILVGGPLTATYQALGAHTKPSLLQWRKLFVRLGEAAALGSRGLTKRERVAVFLAYEKLGSLPAEFDKDALVFIDGTGHLHSHTDARALRYLINDDPKMAAVIAEMGLQVAFADVSDATSWGFYTSSGVSRLTEARNTIDTIVGEERAEPIWFNEAEELARLQKPALCSAVHALAAVGGSDTATKEPELRARLRNLKRIAFVSSLEKTYRIGGSVVAVCADVGVDQDRIVLRSVRSRSGLYGLLARAIASLADTAPDLQHVLADSMYRLLTCNSLAEIKHYLAQRGIEWNESALGELPAEVNVYEDEDEEDEDWEQRMRIGETLTEELLSASLSRNSTRSYGASSAKEDPDLANRLTRSSPLPPISEVDLLEVEVTAWAAPDRATFQRGPSDGWTPRTPAEQENDREIGERGEELVYHAEVARVAALGLPVSRVVWTSKSNPAADHDILSVAEDGGDLWLEVKSTTGRRGRFDWSRAEFELALKVRGRYVLCRVYEAGSKSAAIVRVADPIEQLLLGRMRLDISNLVAEVAPFVPDSN